MSSTFFSSVGRLIGGTALGQLVVIAALPVITRFYSPTDFGAASAFIAALAVINSVSSLRYEFALTLPRCKIAAVHVAFIASGCVVVTALATGAVALWFDEHPGFYVIGIIVLGHYSIGSRWAAREGQFSTIAWTRFQQGLAGAASQIALGFFNAGANGLIAGQIIGQGAGLTQLARGMWQSAPHVGPSWKRAWWAVKRYRNFATFDTGAALLNALGSQAPLLVFATFYSPAAAGFYALATRLVTAPNSLVGTAVGSVLLPRIVSENREGNLAPFVYGLAGQLAWGLVPFALLATLSNRVIAIGFGPEWAPAAFILGWTAIWGGVQFVAAPLSVVLIGLERQNVNAAIQSLLTVTRAVALAVGVLSGSFEVTVALFSLASLGSYLAFLVVIGRVIGREILSPLLAPVTVSGLIFVLVTMLQ